MAKCDTKASIRGSAALASIVAAAVVGTAALLSVQSAMKLGNREVANEATRDIATEANRTALKLLSDLIVNYDIREQVDWNGVATWQTKNPLTPGRATDTIRWTLDTKSPQPVFEAFYCDPKRLTSTEEAELRAGRVPSLDTCVVERRELHSVVTFDAPTNNMDPPVFQLPVTARTELEVDNSKKTFNDKALITLPPPQPECEITGPAAAHIGSDITLQVKTWMGVATATWDDGQALNPQGETRIRRAPSTPGQVRYQITLTGPGGTTGACSIQVDIPPECTLTATPVVTPTGTVNLTYTTKGATSGTFSVAPNAPVPADLDPIPVSGTSSVVLSGGAFAFTLTVFGGGLSATCTASVNNSCRFADWSYSEPFDYPGYGVSPFGVLIDYGPSCFDYDHHFPPIRPLGGAYGTFTYPRHHVYDTYIHVPGWAVPHCRDTNNQCVQTFLYHKCTNPVSTSIIWNINRPDCTVQNIFTRPTAGGCFTPETKIRLADGTDLPVSLIRHGHRVFNPLNLKTYLVRKVIKGPELIPLVRVFSKGLMLEVTEGHAFRTMDGLVTAADLVVGNRLVINGDQNLTIDKVERILRPDQEVWNFELEAPENDLDAHFVLSNGIPSGDLVIQNHLARKITGRMP